MKKLVVIPIIIIFIASMVSAQGIREGNEANPETRSGQRPHARPQNRDNSNRQREFNSVTINGTLKLERGIVAVQSDTDASSVYFVPMLNRFIGFINGLREDARVTIEGNQFNNFIQPTKLTIEGRTYDFPVFNRGHGFGNFENKQRHKNFKHKRLTIN